MTTDLPGKHTPRPIRLGKYEVVAHIATGGMGAVYRARDPQTGREVAIKVLPPDAAARSNMVDRFRHEALSAARLRHADGVHACLLLAGPGPLRSAYDQPRAPARGRPLAGARGW